MQFSSRYAAAFHHKTAWTWPDSSSSSYFLKIPNNLGGTYVLMNDIDCEGMALPIIGADSTTPFRGVFEGQGYTIKNYAPQSNQYIGLFGYNTGTIRNLNVEAIDWDIQSSNTSDAVYVGGIAGYNAGTIEKCAAIEGDIYINLTNERRAGLIAGESSGKILNCFATGAIKIEGWSTYNSYWAIAGGIAATNRGEIANCYVNASMYAYSDANHDSAHGEAALICAANESSGTIKNCFVT